MKLICPTPSCWTEITWHGHAGDFHSMLNESIKHRSSGGQFGKKIIFSCPNGHTFELYDIKMDFNAYGHQVKQPITQPRENL